MNTKNPAILTALILCVIFMNTVIVVADSVKIDTGILVYTDNQNVTYTMSQNLTFNHTTFTITDDGVTVYGETSDFTPNGTMVMNFSTWNDNDNNFTIVGENNSVAFTLVKVGGYTSRFEYNGNITSSPFNASSNSTDAQWYFVVNPVVIGGGGGGGSPPEEYINESGDVISELTLLQKIQVLLNTKLIDYRYDYCDGDVTDTDLESNQCVVNNISFVFRLKILLVLLLIGILIFILMKTGKRVKETVQKKHVEPQSRF